MKDGKFTDADLGTILAGLRLWQLALEKGVIIPVNAKNISLRDIFDISTNGGKFKALTADQIDDLCEALNTVPDFVECMNRSD